MKALDGLVRDQVVDGVHTWEARATGVELNFIEDGSNGATSLAYNQRLQKKLALQAKHK